MNPPVRQTIRWCTQDPFRALMLNEHQACTKARTLLIESSSNEKKRIDFFPLHSYSCYWQQQIYIANSSAKGITQTVPKVGLWNEVFRRVTGSLGVITTDRQTWFCTNDIFFSFYIRHNPKASNTWWSWWKQKLFYCFVYFIIRPKNAVP